MAQTQPEIRLKGLNCIFKILTSIEQRKSAVLKKNTNKCPNISVSYTEVYPQNAPRKFEPCGLVEKDQVYA